MTTFCSVADIDAFLHIPIEQWHSAQRAIEEATAAIQNYCHQHLAYVANDTITLDSSGSPVLLLPELPVLSVRSVTEDGILLDPTEYKLGASGFLWRVGRNWTSGIQVVTVIYDHGYIVIPEVIVAVCTRAAARAYQAGLRAEEAGGVPGVQSTSLGDYSVAFGSEQSVGAGEALLGASAAPMLLRSEMAMLNNYRVKP